MVCTRQSHARLVTRESYRTRAPVRVVGEVAEWERQQGIEAIDE